MTKEELTVQSAEDVRLQKYRSSLISSGGAMVLFALWAVLRSMVQIEARLNNPKDSEMLRPLIASILAVGIVELILMLYVGLSARVEGLGRKKKRPYLVLGIIIACLSVLSVGYMLYQFPEDCRLYGLLMPLVNLAVEATFLYAAMDLVVSAIKVRRLEKKMGRV